MMGTNKKFPSFFYYNEKIFEKVSKIFFSLKNLYYICNIKIYKTFFRSIINNRKTILLY